MNANVNQMDAELSVLLTTFITKRTVNAGVSAFQYIVDKTMSPEATEVDYAILTVANGILMQSAVKLLDHTGYLQLLGQMFFITPDIYKGEIFNLMLDRLSEQDIVEVMSNAGYSVTPFGPGMYHFEMPTN